MTQDTQETAVLLIYNQGLVQEQALEKYRQSTPVVSVAGLCYATPEYAGLLRQEGLPYHEGFHLTLVEGINMGMRSAERNNYDFILMAGPQKSQLEDILRVAKAQFFSSRKSPVYVLGEMTSKTSGLLKILGPAYGLQHIPIVHTITEIDEINGV